jgi:uncharacterized DUF497 family protein
VEIACDFQGQWERWETGVWFSKVYTGRHFHGGVFVRRSFLRMNDSFPVLLNVYTSRYTIHVAQDIEFEWDDENRKHLAAHKVTPAEFEYVLTNNPVDLGYELVDDEDRYRAVGLTGTGRLLTVVWTPRNGSVRAVTAFPATVSDKKAFLEMSR